MVDNSEPHVGVYLYNQRSNLFHGNTYVYFTLLLRSLMNFIIKSETSSNSSIQNINLLPRLKMDKAVHPPYKLS